MASISKEPNGRRTVQFVGADDKRRSIRLGKVPQRVAEEVKGRVERIIAAQVAQVALDADTARWVSQIGDELADKLAAVGLISRRARMTLKEFVEDYMSGRKDLRENTHRHLAVSAARMVEFFGGGRDLRSITAGDCDRFAEWMLGKYAPATASRTIRRGRQFFRRALRMRLVQENPFEGVSTPGETNTARGFFVTRQMAQKVLDAIPERDAEWRLIFVLSRFAGLRCPSELLRLRWEDIDWGRGRMLVHATKTERHQGKGQRWVPIFPEVRALLGRVFEEAEDGATFIITRYRDSRVNLRTRLLKTIKRAGLTPWPRLFQNLRASCETELCQRFPVHVVVAWMGHGVRVAADHYLQVRDEDFERAVQGGAESGAEAVQNSVQSASAGDCQQVTYSRRLLEKPGVRQVLSTVCNSLQAEKAPLTGLEPARTGV